MSARPTTSRLSDTVDKREQASSQISVEAERRVSIEADEENPGTVAAAVDTTTTPSLDVEASKPSTSMPAGAAAAVLTREQVAKIEANRKRALEIRQSKQETAAKIAKLASSTRTADDAEPTHRLIDSGAGFYVNEDDLHEEERKELNPIEPPPVPLPSDKQLTCGKCNKRFPHSYLSLNFDANVCDTCRYEHPDEFKLMTRTDAKAEFLLKDCDFEVREPPLRFVMKPNPHRRSWGEMKLYLRSQCEQRAVLVHKGLDELEVKKESRQQNVHKARQKTYEKRLQTLRKEARQGSRKNTQYHQHDFADEVYDEERDVYVKRCKTCEHSVEMEQL